MPLKRHSGNSWRSTKESGSPFRTWWRARRETWPNWRELGLQWSGDGAQKERVERRRTEMMWRGLRMAPERRGLCRPPPVRILVLFFLLIEFIYLFISCELNVWVRKVRIKWKEVWKFWEETLKGVRKLRVNENKRTEYTREIKWRKKSPLEMYGDREQMQ